MSEVPLFQLLMLTSLKRILLLVIDRQSAGCRSINFWLKSRFESKTRTLIPPVFLRAAKGREPYFQTRAEIKQFLIKGKFPPAGLA